MDDFNSLMECGDSSVGISVLKEEKGLTWGELAIAVYQILESVYIPDDCMDDVESFSNGIKELFFRGKKGNRSSFEALRDATAQVTYGKPFADLPAAKQKKILNNMKKKGFRIDRSSYESVSESVMMDWAQEEVQRAGLLDEDADYEGLLGEAVLDLMSTFTGQGHSGMSSNMVLEIFNKLASWKPLTKLTSDPTEWMEVTEGVWQSRRNPACFSEDGGKTYTDQNDPCWLHEDEDGYTYFGRPENPEDITIHESEHVEV